MRAVWASAVMAVAMDAFASSPDEAQIEQLMNAPARPAAATARPEKKGAAKNEPDSAASLVGQRVAVETRQRGFYIGTLTAVTRETLTLAIELPARSVSYSLPRGDVASVTVR